MTPGPITSLMLAQMRRSVTGSWARTFQKLFTQSVLRVAMMSSYTARTSGEASAYSIGWRLTGILSTSPVSAVSVAVKAIYKEPEHRPDCESDPGVSRQRKHEPEAD